MKLGSSRSPEARAKFGGASDHRALNPDQGAPALKHRGLKSIRTAPLFWKRLTSSIEKKRAGRADSRALPGPVGYLRRRAGAGDTMAQMGADGDGGGGPPHANTHEPLKAAAHLLSR